MDTRLELNDKVKILKGGWFLEDMVGKVGVIITIGAERLYPYTVQVGARSGHFSGDELEKINKEESNGRQ